MPKFLTTTGISYEIENIIKGAKSKLALISPYLKLSQNFYERLRDANKKNVTILIIYGKEELNIEQKNQLSELQNLKLFFCANLHAKCYMNENSCVITSMNMYEFSEKNNREMGVLFSRIEDEAIFLETAEEIKSIISNSKESDILTVDHKEYEKINKYNKSEHKYIKTDIQPPKNQFSSSFFGGILNVATSFLKTEGYCLRCGTRIKHDLNKPFCLSCFQQWVFFSNPDYVENHCHTCGKQRKTSFAKPECKSCFSS